MLHLPNKNWLRIFDHLDSSQERSPEDLGALHGISIVSKTFHALVEPLLYRQSTKSIKYNNGGVDFDHNKNIRPIVFDNSLAA